MVKNGTPTMGGSLILGGILVPTLCWSDLTNVYIWIVLLTTVVGLESWDSWMITRRSVTRMEWGSGLDTSSPFKWPWA